MSLPLHLRAYQEPTKDELTRLYFNVPPLEWVSGEAAATPVKTASWVGAMSDKGKEPMVAAPGTQSMEISAILSVEGKDEVYVSSLLPAFCAFCSIKRTREGVERHEVTVKAVQLIPLFSIRPCPHPISCQSGRLNLLPPFLCFVSLDKRSARFSLPLYTIRRVERLNSRAGVFALSLATWHGMRLVSAQTSLFPSFSGDDIKA